MNFSFEVTGQEKLLFELNGVATDLSVFPARAASDEAFAIVREQIFTQGRSGGHPYPRYAESTLQSIRSQNRRGVRHTGEMLRASGTLFNAVGTRGAPHGIYREESDGVTFGTDLYYARFHQFGTVKMAARLIYDFGERQIKRLASVIRRAYREKIADRGFDFQETAEIPF